jgi:membrane fusion protein, multidrug efflux system
MLKKFLIGFAVLAVFIVPIFVIKAKQFGPPPAFEFPPEVVTSAIAQAQDWERITRAVGSLRADHGVVVASEGQGTVRRIAFESGSVVQRGDVLIELDTEVELAQVASAESRAALARVNAERARDLWQTRATSKAELDGSEATLQQAIADVESIKATIDKKTMRAPFTGRTGIRRVNLGQFVDRGAPIVTLQSLDPIHADFALPQQRLGDVQAGQVVRLTTDARPGTVFEGRVTAISPEVDASTRTVRVQATLANADEKLSPGMFVTVEVVAQQKNRVVVIPSTAVYYQPFGDSIFVIKDVTDEKTGQTVRRAEQRFVRLGEARGDFVAVNQGLQPGEEVVTTGVFKLQNGSSVAVDNTHAPKAELAPRPSNS